MEVQQDPLWRQAQKRVGFKRNLFAYVIFNSFLWCVWYFTDSGGYMWPVWPMLGWGIGLAFNYADAYHFNKDEMLQREYDKLKGGQK